MSISYIPPQLYKLMQLLSADQQTEYINIFTNQDLFIDRSTVLHRKTLQLPANLTNDEVRQAIANAYGLSLEKIPQVDMKQSLENIETHKKNIVRIIEPYKRFLTQHRAPKDKHDELYDLGRFIYSINHTMEIFVPLKLHEYPDFQIMNENRIIGIEHTRLIDEKQIAAFKTVKRIIKAAENELKPDFESAGKTFNLFFNYDMRISGQGNFKDGGISSNEKKALIKVIVEYIQSILIGNPIQAPAFVSHLQISENKDHQLYLELGEDYLTSHFFINQLLVCMAKKEIKANKYRKAIPSENLWLLIVVDDINSFSGFDLAATRLPILKYTNFDKIFLYEKFNGLPYLLTAT